MAPGPLQMPHSSYAPTQSSTSRHRCHRHRRPLRSHRRTRPRRRAGCRRSRSLIRDVRTSALVDGARTVADAAVLVVRTHAVVDVVAECHRHRRPLPASHLHTHQARRAGFRRSRSLLLGCQNIRTRRWRQDRCRCRTRRTHPRSRRRRRRCHRHRRPLRSHRRTRPRRRAGFRRSRSLLGMSEHPHS